MGNDKTIKNEEQLGQTQGQDGNATGGNAVVEEKAVQQPKTIIEAYWNLLGDANTASNKAVEQAKTVYEEEKNAADVAKTAWETALSEGISLRNAITQEQKPQRKEELEQKMRNNAMIKGFGDLASALAVGINAYGKNGAGVVPTLASNSPLKDIEKLNEIQEEYLKRREAWNTIEQKLRMEDAATSTAKAQSDYERALSRMATAQELYNERIADSEALGKEYRDTIGKLAMAEIESENRKALEEKRHKNNLEVARARSRGGSNNSGATKGGQKPNAKEEAEAKEKAKAETERRKTEKAIAEKAYISDKDARRFTHAQKAAVGKFIDQGYSAYEAIDMVAQGKSPNDVVAQR